MTDLSAAWNTLDEQEAAKWAWLTAGPRISFDDLNAGTGGVQRMSPSDLRAAFAGTTSGGSHGGAAKGGQPIGTARPAAKPSLHVMAFGKRHGELMANVKEDDPRYWQWLLSDVPGFEAKARKAGLLDDNDDLA